MFLISDRHLGFFCYILLAENNGFLQLNLPLKIRMLEWVPSFSFLELTISLSIHIDASKVVS